MEQELKASLLAVAEIFAAKRGLMLSTVALRAAKDARFFERIGDGKGFTVRTYDSVMAWFSANWPEGADWPEGIDRPDPAALNDAEPEAQVS